MNEVYSRGGKIILVGKVQNDQLKDLKLTGINIEVNGKLNIPIIGILDSNSDPDNIDFPIPGNDDARRSINLYCDLIKKTIIDAKKKIKVSEQEVKLTQSKTKVSDKKEASIKITNKKSKEEKK